MPTEARNVPALRFPEFSGEWEEKKLKNVALINPSNQKLPTKFTYIDLESVVDGLLVKEEVIELENAPSRAQRLLENNDILFQTVRPYQKNNLFFDKGENYVASTGYAQLRSLCRPNYLYHYLHNDDFVRKVIFRCTGTGYPAINSSDLATVPLSLPTLPEQQKIATFLTSIDAKIELLTKKRALLEQFKKGVMQQLFRQQIRFKDNGEEYPDWEEKKLNTWLYETKQRNVKMVYDKGDVLSVSGEFGVVNQIEFLGRSYAGESVDNYHIVRTGDIVYTKSPLKANPYGIVKVNKGEPGIVSTLYAVYGCRDNVSGEYLDYYFQLDDNTNSYLRPLVHKGAKNDMKINNAHVLSGKIRIPSKAEQLQIVGFLNSIDVKIDTVDQQLTLTKTFKKGLLQQLFV